MPTLILRLLELGWSSRGFPVPCSQGYADGEHLPPLQGADAGGGGEFKGPSFLLPFVTADEILLVQTFSFFSVPVWLHDHPGHFSKVSTPVREALPVVAETKAAVFFIAFFG